MTPVELEAVGICEQKFSEEAIAAFDKAMVAEDLYEKDEKEVGANEDNHYLDDFETAVKNAEEAGFTIVHGTPNTLLLDLDSEADWEFFNKTMLPILMDTSAVDIMKIDHWKSKSGVGYHVVITVGKPLKVMERLLLQACLGSDRKHELLSLVRGVWCGNASPTVLFKPGVAAPSKHEEPTEDFWGDINTVKLDA